MKKKLLVIATMIIAASLLGACSNKADKSSNGEAQAENTTSNEQKESSSSVKKFENGTKNGIIIDNSSLPQLEPIEKGEQIAVLKTNKGDIKLRFFPEVAPKAVENFITHAKEGYYDGVTFHRVIKDFMIQGGDPKGDGTGGESIWGEEFANEVSTSLRSFRGALCMANAGPDTNGSQFYIVQNKDIGNDMKAQFQEYIENQDEKLNPDDESNNLTIGDVYPTRVMQEYIENGGCPHLDFGYTIFGQVYEGIEIVDAIAEVQTNENDKPLEDIIIKGIEIGEY